MGYCIARYAQQDGDTSQFDTSKVCIDSMAIVPRHQRKGIATVALLELLSRTEDRNVGSVDFHLRDSTSYPAIMRRRSLIENYGFELTEIDSDKPLVLDTGEALHHVVLHK